MGIKLTPLIPRKEISFDDLKGKKIAIDASNMLYQFLSSIRQRDGTLLMDSHGNVTSHLMGIFSRLTNLMNRGIKLAVIFDGKPPLLKLKQQEERAYRKVVAEEKMRKALEEEEEEEAYKYAKQTSRLTREIVEESKELVSALGMPVIQAPSEAEAQAAFICEQGDVWAVASSDVDCLVYGATRMIPNLTLSQKRKLPSGGYIITAPEIIELKDVLNNLGIDKDQLLVLGILVGSVDHNEPTIIKDNNGIRVVKIGRLYDEILKNKVKYKFSVPCFDYNTKKITFKNVKKFIKHVIDEPLYEITTTYNRKVKVTASHSLFTFKNNKIMPIKTTDIKVNDKLIIPLKIPCISEIKEINIPILLWNNKDKIKRNVRIDGPAVMAISKMRFKNRQPLYRKVLTDRRLILSNEGRIKILQARNEKNITQNNTILSDSTVYSWEKGLSNPTLALFTNYLNFLDFDANSFINNKEYIAGFKDSILNETVDFQMGLNLKYRKTLLLKSLSDDEIKLITKVDKIYSRKFNAISTIINVTSDLTGIIGYYLAEGNPCNNYRLSFSFNYKGKGHDDYCVKDLKEKIYNIFKLKIKVYNERTGQHICIDNTITHDLFIHGLQLGGDSINKTMSSLMYNVNEDCKLEFLKAFFLGDGSLNKNTITFNTSSDNLAEGLTYLLLQLGIIASLDKKKDGMNTITVCGKQQLLRLKYIWIKHHKSKELFDYCNKPLNKKGNVTKLNDLGIVKVKHIKKIKSSNKYVYDFSVDGENFIAGYGGVCCHNTDYNIGGVKGIGPKTALKLVKQYKNFDELFEQVKPDFNWKEIYAVFKSMPIMKNYQLKWKEADIDKVKEILVERHEFSEERVDNGLKKLIKEANEVKKKKAQKGLGEFF